MIQSKHYCKQLLKLVEYSKDIVKKDKNQTIIKIEEREIHWKR